MQQITVNEADLRRILSDRHALLGGLDAKRPDAWRVFGYSETVTFDLLFRAYTRGGPAQGAVHRLLDKCWEQLPRIKSPASDDETPWEIRTAATLRAVQAWAKLRDADRRGLIGRYAGMIYRVADGLPLREPLVRGAQLVDIIPLYESQLRVTAWNADQSSPDFGKPTMWQYRTRRPDAADSQGQPEQWADVHPSRVHVFAEGAVGDDFLNGVPFLQAGLNALVDLEKITGGSAESFLKNSARTVTVNFDADASPQAITTNPDGSASGKSVRQVVQDQVDALNRNIDSALVTQGAQAGVLQTAIADPEKAFTVAANLFAAAVRIPMTILFGAQTGRLASDEDRADIDARATARRNNEITPRIEQFIRRMQAVGVIEAGEFEVEWPALGTPSDKDKAEVLGKMTTAMQQAFQSGSGQPLFDNNELRRVVGYEPQEEAEALPAVPPDPEAA
jgi:hypothetical protein